MNKKINVGLIGYGAAGQFFHAPFISKQPGMVLHTVVERRSEKARERYPEIRSVKEVAAVLNDEAIDLVVIATPNATHYELARMALLAGKHLVVDKPFVPTSQEAIALIELSRQQKKILSVYQNRRWDGGFLTVKQILEKNLLGPLVEYEARFDRFRNVVNKEAWKEKESPGSGILYDLGAHLIDQALLLFGMPVSLQADIRSQRPGALVDDYFEINLNYTHLKVILKAGVLVKQPSAVFSLYGLNGSYVKYGLDPQEGRLRLGAAATDPAIGKEERQYWGHLDTELNGIAYSGLLETLPGAYVNYYDNICNAISGLTPLAVKPEEALAVIRIIELARISHQEMRTVVL